MENENKRTKMAVIAGASKALDYKEDHPGATEQEIIQHVSDKLSEILNKVDKDLG